MIQGFRLARSAGADLDVQVKVVLEDPVVCRPQQLWVVDFHVRQSLHQHCDV